MSLIDDIKLDRENGTVLCITPLMNKPHDKYHVGKISADKRRVIRVPEMEAAILEMHEALKFIALSDDTENALDPERNKRIARAILAKIEGYAS